MSRAAAAAAVGQLTSSEDCLCFSAVCCRLLKFLVQLKRDLYVLKGALRPHGDDGLMEFSGGNCSTETDMQRHVNTMQQMTVIKLNF